MIFVDNRNKLAAFAKTARWPSAMAAESNVRLDKGGETLLLTSETGAAWTQGGMLSHPCKD